MAANLLAEFDSFYQGGSSSIEHAPADDSQAATAHGDQIPPAQQPRSPTNPWSTGPVFEDDEFGDFETAEPASRAQQNVPRPTDAAVTRPDTSKVFTPPYTDAPRPQPFRASSSDIIHGRLARPQRVQHPFTLSQESNVLFDAEDEDEQVETDDFGEFSQAEPPSKPEQKPMDVFLHPVEPRTKAEPPPAPPSPPSLLDLDTVLDSATAATVKPLPSVTKKLDDAGDDAFDAWEPVEPEDTGTGTVPAVTVLSSEEPTAVSNAPTATEADASSLLSLDLPPLLSQRDAPTGPPPSNVPPPAVLLPVFPRIFSNVQKMFLDQLPQDSGERSHVTRQPATVVFLADEIKIATCCAHIIAGRKNRWKRDTKLAQSMRISQASGKGGMKLTGIDKSEDTKEEREASEVVRTWRSHSARLRSVVAGLGLTSKLPEMSDAMPVRLATLKEGGISAPKPCVVCGLKRNERVPKIDVNVQDSFGEWWVEHWGHRSCVSFWESYKQTLTGR